MAGKSVEPPVDQEWSLHAQLTISHGSAQVEAVVPRPRVHPSYGFQRGNIVFTTKPPGDSSSLPTRRAPQPYGRRCMSTCNITLDPAHPHAHVPARCHHTVTLSCDPHDECDVCSGGRLSPTCRAHTYTSHFCTRVPDKTVGTKTVASQTSQIFTPPTPPPADKPNSLLVPRRDDKKTSGNKSPRTLSRSPARLRGKSPLLNKSTTETKKKQPRTVHIDVYCTGSEASGSSDAEDPSDSSRQTVFESEAVRVVHTREDDRLPQALCRQKRRTLSEASSSHSCLGSTEAGDTSISSLYPSQRSSFASGVSLQSSLQTDSSLLSRVTSSCALFSDDVITSWKDTSDVDSVIRQSDLSIPRTESFEYADTTDRWRILEKEKAWGNQARRWRSPEVEQKHQMQQRRHQQFVERRGSPFPHWQACGDDDDDEPDGSSSDLSEHSEGSEMAWSFSNLDERAKHVKREDTVRRASKEAKHELQMKKQASKILDSGSLSDSAAPSPVLQHKLLKRDNIGPFGVKEPSPPKPKLESTVTTPFTSTPGKKTDQLSKAEKFGTILGTLRKPGHHVGPSKNPDCSCQNCQQFYEEMGYRTRTHSLGDMPSSKDRAKWKATLESLRQTKFSEDSGSGEWDMGTPV